MHYIVCCYRHLGRITAITDGSIILFFTSYTPYLAGSAAYLAGLIALHFLASFYLHYFPFILLSLFNCALASNAVSLPPLWYQSHSFLAGDSVVVFSVSPSVSTRNFGAQLLCSLLTVVGTTLVVK